MSHDFFSDANREQEKQENVRGWERQKREDETRILSTEIRRRWYSWEGWQSPCWTIRKNEKISEEKEQKVIEIVYILIMNKLSLTFSDFHTCGVESVRDDLIIADEK